MLRVVLVLLVVTYITALQTPRLDGRIVGGLSTHIDEYPYQASIQYFKHHMCGGSIISHQFIITAAHCTEGIIPEALSVRVGSSVREHGGQEINVLEIFPNHQFNIGTMDYDIAILRLAEFITFGVHCAPIKIIPENYQMDFSTNFIVTGWGTLTEDGVSSAQLQVVEVSYIENEKCQEAYRNSMKISERMICAGVALGGRDACQGDSGGPLVTDNFLVGIVSWGYGCARPQYPGVYSRVSQLRNFIKNVTSI